MLVNYLQIILAQKGVDCDALADLLLAIEPHVDQQQYATYKTSIIATSYNQLEQTTKELEKLRQELNQAEQENHLRLQAQVAYKIDRFLSAKEALEMLGETKG